MGGQVWEVVGGGDKGGVLVRTGRDLGSAQAASRLSTGALVEEVELVADRLSFKRLTGTGPDTGWVSTRLQSKDLLVKADRAPPRKLDRPPILACFYSGGMTAPQGRSQLRAWLAEAKKAGFPDAVVLDHVGEPGYADCADLDDYTARLAGKLDEDAAFRGRPVLIVAHSHGCLPAYALARRLGGRCAKLYVVARRPPNGSLTDDAFGVDSSLAVAQLDDEHLLNGMLDTWSNPMLERHRNASPLPENIREVLAVVRRQYSCPWLPCGSADVEGFLSGAPALETPILAISASGELPRGETAAKMEGWKEFTTADFRLQSTQNGHLEAMGPKSPVLGVLLADMQLLLP